MTVPWCIATGVRTNMWSEGSTALTWCTASFIKYVMPHARIWTCTVHGVRCLVIGRRCEISLMASGTGSSAPSVLFLVLVQSYWTAGIECMNGLAGFASLWPRASHSKGQAVFTLYKQSSVIGGAVMLQGSLTASTQVLNQLMYARVRACMCVCRGMRVPKSINRLTSLYMSVRTHCACT